MLAFVLPLLVLLGWFQPLLERLELVLLDYRLMQRAQRAAPDPDIVVIAVDRETEGLIKRHPELNIRSLPLPRQYLAQIIDYLHEHGAAQIILDLDIIEPRPGDDALAAAIARAGSVLTTLRLENRYEEYVEENRIEPVMIRSQHFIAHWLKPYIQQQQSLHEILSVGLMNPAISTVWPLLFGDNLLQVSQSQWRAFLAHQLNSKPLGISRVSLMQPLLSSIHSSQSADAIVRDYYHELCTVTNYHISYPDASPMLAVLMRERVNVLDEGLSQTGIDQATYCYAKPLVDEILPHTRGLGVVSVNKREDGLLRSVPLVYWGYRGNQYVYLGLKVAMQSLGAERLQMDHQALRLLDAQGRIIKTLPLQAGQTLLINWRNPVLGVYEMLKRAGMSVDLKDMQRQVRSNSDNRLLGGGQLYRHISAIDLMQVAGHLNLPEHQPLTMFDIPTMGYVQAKHSQSGNPNIYDFKGKTVFIGDTVMDIHHTPVGHKTYGVEILASAYDMIKNDRKFIRLLPTSGLFVLMAVMISLNALTILRVKNMMLAVGVGLLTLLFYWLSACYLFVEHALWIPVALPLLIVLIAIATCSLYRYYIHDKDLYDLTNIFANYVSPQVMERILANPQRAQETLKGQKKELTVIFTDIKGFTRQFAEDSPETVMTQLGMYFDAMIEIILKYDGTYDKFMGDGLLAFFGSPVEASDHAGTACRVALEMQEALARLNRYFIENGYKTLEHGVGVSTGEVFVGNFGSATIKNYTVMGQSVNLGARLQVLTRKVDKTILISEETYQQVKDCFVVHPLGCYKVRGFMEPVPVYSLETLLENSSSLSKN